MNKIWADLLDEGEEEEKIASDINSTRQTYEADARRLNNLEAKYE